MSREGIEYKTVNHYISGGQGGEGGRGGEKGGDGGAAEGTTMHYDISAVESFTTHNIGGAQTHNLSVSGGGSLVIHNHGLVEDLGKWLEYPPDTKDKQYHLRSLHHEATGRWLLLDDRFVKWKTTPGSLWIKGISGTGKSVLSSTVIEEITVACPERSAVAYFYFDFRNENQRKDIMLRSIIWQLSGRSPSPYSALGRLYKTLGNGTIQPQHRHLQVVLEDLLADIDRTYIVIDGLDECDKSDWKPLVQFIHTLDHLTENAPHLLFTSQPLDEFQEAFKNVAFIELSSEISTPDIRTFVGSEVPGVGNRANDVKNAKHITEQIVQKSNGMFRMAACLLLELGRCLWEDDWEMTLTALPADLFKIYSRFLTRAKDSLPAIFIQAILRWLVFSAREIRLDELADATAFRLADPGFDFSDPDKSIYHPNRRRGNCNGFKLLEGLIVIKHDGSATPLIAPAHSSVRDYVLSPEFQREFGASIDLTMDVSHKFITQTCVRYLLLFADIDHLMTKDTLPDYPLSLYAAEYWFHHLRLCDNQDQAALLPSTMRLLEDGSSQYTALYKLYDFKLHSTWRWSGFRDMSPMVMCCKMGYTEGVHSLLIKDNTAVHRATSDGRTALYFASENGHLDIVQLLIDYDASVDQPDKYGRTALHLTSGGGHLDVVQLLIKHDASINQAEGYGRTALHLALENGHVDVARLLIEHNASGDRADEYGRTALHLALENGHLNIVQLLMEHSTSINEPDKYGRTALHLTSENGHLNIAQLLIGHNVSVDHTDKYGRTALHLASGGGHLNIVHLLIEHNASVGQPDKHGRTALHLASGEGHFNIVHMLIKHNASVDQPDTYGRTALHLTSENGHLDIAQLLIEHNASVDQPDKYGGLHLASGGDHLDVGKDNASVDRAQGHGRTPLHLALENGHLDVVQLLIKHNAPVNQPDQYGGCALHLASRRGHLDIVQALIEHNASVDQPDASGRTALHLSSENGHFDIAQLLIKHNASVNQADNYGKTALHLASRRGHLDVIQLLVEHTTSIYPATLQ